MDSWCNFLHHDKGLPDSVILANNVNQFKNRLDKHWKMHDIIFNYRADFAETGGLA